MGCTLVSPRLEQMANVALEGLRVSLGQVLFSGAAKGGPRQDQPGMFCPGLAENANTGLGRTWELQTSLQLAVS